VFAISPQFIETCSFLYLNFSLGLDVSMNIANRDLCFSMDYMVQNPLHTAARLDCIPTFVLVRLENCLRCVVSGMGVLS
jgi:hypothetical protein